MTDARFTIASHPQVSILDIAVERIEAGSVSLVRTRVHRQVPGFDPPWRTGNRIAIIATRLIDGTETESLAYVREENALKGPLARLMIPVNCEVIAPGRIDIRLLQVPDRHRRLVIPVLGATLQKVHVLVAVTHALHPVVPLIHPVGDEDEQAVFPLLVMRPGVRAVVIQVRRGCGTGDTGTAVARATFAG